MLLSAFYLKHIYSFLSYRMNPEMNFFLLLSLDVNDVTKSYHWILLQSYWVQFPSWETSLKYFGRMHQCLRIVFDFRFQMNSLSLNNHSYFIQGSLSLVWITSLEGPAGLENKCLWRHSYSYSAKTLACLWLGH